MRHHGSDDGRGSGVVTASPPAVAPGDLLKDRYDVVALIGSGGMADVFEGIDNLFQRDVAIKVLKPERIDEVMQRRVLREARATCAVDHPHMLRITDMGFAGEAPFLVSDLLQGHSLAEELRRAPGGRLEWRRVVRLLLPAMAALHDAHDAGLIHRDIKPENLFLHHRRGAEVVIVLDLGIVKYVALDGTPSRWTRSGIILGTALYMPPEQVNAGAVDRRSDVYAMGVTLYRLLSGQHLFPSPSEDGPISAMTKHLYEPPPRLAGRFPPPLVAAILKAVAKEPDRRHRSMAEFAAILSACLDRDEVVRRRFHSTGLACLGAALALAGSQLVRDEAAPATCPPASTVTDTPEPATAPEPIVDAAPASIEVVPDLIGPARPPRSPGRRHRPPDELARAGDAVRQCMRVHGALDTRSLTVKVAVGEDGRVAATSFIGPYAASFLGACVRDRIAELRFTPGSPRTLEHTYHLATHDPNKESP